MYKELISLCQTEENWNRLYDNINHLYNDYWTVFANPNTYGIMPDDVKRNFKNRVKDLQQLVRVYGED